MGYANEIRECFEQLVRMVNDAEGATGAGQLRDEIAYALHCSNIRMYAEDLGITINPYHVITLDEDSVPGEIRVLDCKGEYILHLDNRGGGYDCMSQSEIFSELYEEYWQDIMVHYDHMDQ